MRRLENKGIIVFLLLLPYFRPASFRYLAPSMNMLFNGLRIISAVIAIFLYLKNIILKKQKSWFCANCVIWQLFIIISSYLNNRDIKESFIAAVTLITFCMLSEVCIKENAKVYFSSLFNILFIIILVNFIGLLLYPNGIITTEYYYYSMNFWDIDNQMSPILILGVVCSIFIIWYEKKKTLAYFLIMLSFATTVIIWSATGVVGMLIFILFLILSSRASIQKICCAKVVYLGMALVNILLVFFRLHIYFENFIIYILGKSLELSGRTEMWNQAILLIRKKFLTGYGMPEIYGYIFWHNKFYYTHNGVLEVLIRGGLFSFIPFLFMIAVSGIQLDKYRTSRIEIILLAGILANMVTLLTEAYIMQIPILALFLFAYNIEKIIIQNRKKLLNKKQIILWVPFSQINVVRRKNR